VRATQIWHRILLALAVVLLACAVKNYAVFLIRGTAACPYLCPSSLGPDFWTDLPGLGALYRAQHALMGWLRGLDPEFGGGHWHLVTRLISAPVVEELIYRGPPYLLRRYSRHPAWWVGASLLAVLFALAHGRGGVALLPLLVLGMANVWLVASTGRFWPALGLHVLYNFFFTSVLLSRAVWASD
jgi:membrane protease YdiL (CAAX protease family)